MKEKIDNDLEIEINQQIISNKKRNNKKRNQNTNNIGQLTKEQFELMKKIRDEAISRTERYTEYTEYTQGNKSNDEFIINEENKKKNFQLEKITQ